MAEPAKEGVLGRTARTIQIGLASTFRKLGLIVAARPGTTILLSLLFFALTMSGMTQFENESRGEKLWAPDDSDDVKNLEAVTAAFAPSARSSDMYILAKDASAAGGALSPDALRETLALARAITAYNVTATGNEQNPTETRSWSFDQLCQRSNGKCTMSSILDPVDYDAAKLDAAIAAGSDGAGAGAYAGYISKLRRTTGIMSFSGRPLVLELALGGVQPAAAATDKAVDMTGATVLRLSFTLENRQYLDGGNAYIDPPAQEFETKLFDDLIKKPSEQTFKHIRVIGNIREAARVESSSAIFGDLGLVGGSIGLIIVYVMLQLGNCTRVGGRIMLALGGVATVGLSLGTGFGLGAIFSFYAPVHSVLPFLIFGIGADDLFVIVNEFDLAGARATKRLGRAPRTNEELTQQMGDALSHSGASITITSLTNTIAFLISSLTVLPALSSFVIWAAIAVAAAFVYSVTFFSALLTYDARRQAANRADCCPCCVAGPLPTSPRGEEAADAEVAKGCCGRKDGELMRGLCEGSFGRTLMRTPVRVCVLLAFAGLAVTAAVGISKSEVEFRREWFLPGDSFLQEYYSLQRQYFSGLGVPVSVYAREIEPFAQGGFFVDARAALSANKYVDVSKPITDWYRAFDEYQTAAAVDKSTQTKAQYHTALRAWLAGAGARYAGDIVWDASDATKISFTRITAFYIGMSKATVELDAMLTLIADVQAVAAKYGFGSHQAFAFSFTFTSWRQFEVIPKEAVQNCGTAVAAIFVVLLLFLADLRMSLIVTGMVALCLVNVLGFMHYWGVFVDAVSVTNLTLSVGLSTDYSAHIGHAFLHAGRPGSSLRDRAVLALREMGVSVFNGALSTFLAVCLLSFSTSYIFTTFFKMFFMTSVFGAAHGLILLPTVLSFIGSPPLDHNGSGDDDADDVSVSDVKASVAASTVEMHTKAGQSGGAAANGSSAGEALPGEAV